MFKQNLLISWRTLVKHKSYALINIGGLALGIFAVLLIALWFVDEVSYNRYHQNYDRIAMVLQNQNFGDEIRTWRGQAMQLAPVLREEYGRYFKEVVTATYINDNLLTWENKKVSRSGSYMEPGIASVLSLNMLAGSRSAFKEPSTILISASTAESVFGRTDPMGQTITLANSMDLEVVGIYEDFPANSSFASLTFIAPWERLKEVARYEERLEWGNSWFQIYVQLMNAVEINVASNAIKDVKQKYIDQEYANKTKPQLFLHPMSKWRLYSDFENGQVVGGRIEYVWMFSTIGFFILFLACINFMNLSTARSEKRSKEIGIRKTVGSRRIQLVNQFLSESFLIVLLAFVLAGIVTWFALPAFNELIGKKMRIPFNSLLFWTSAMAMILVTAFLSGSYPAFFLSSIKPISTLKGQPKNKQGRFTLRQVLVSIQFVISIALIIGTIVIFRQIQHAKNRPVGYDQDNLLVIPIKSMEIMKHYETIRQELLNSGNVEMVAASDVTMDATYTNNSGFNWKGKDPEFSEEFYTLRATHDFGKLVGWQIKEGRDFDREHRTDSLAFILNETAVEYMGFENPIGEMIQWGDNGTYEVIGVVKDMVTTTPYESVRPMLYILHYGGFISYLNVKINPKRSMEATLTKLEQVFTKYDPENLFEYEFTDEAYARKFRDEELLGKLATYFALLAIIISSLGLLGITALATEQRRKEIGIRKVLGASLPNLWMLLSREFLVLMSISLLLSIPLANYYMNGWLEQFTYRINLDWWIFLLSGFLGFVVTLLTISVYIVRAVVADPIQALREE